MKGDGTNPVALGHRSGKETATFMDRKTFDTHLAIVGADDCWPWQRARDAHGYGAFRENGRIVKAHRRAWENANGEIPEGAHILHHCDNPPCCNPAHLYAGSHADNMRDMFSRERRQAAVGEQNGKSRLTAEQVREIRRTYKGRRGERKELCARLGIHKGTLQAIMEGRTWKEV